MDEKFTEEAKCQSKERVVGSLLSGIIDPILKWLEVSACSGQP
jgi:hypothetical protein